MTDRTAACLVLVLVDHGDGNFRSSCAVVFARVLLSVHYFVALGCYAIIHDSHLQVSLAPEGRQGRRRLRAGRRRAGRASRDRQRFHRGQQFHCRARSGRPRDQAGQDQAQVNPGSANATDQYVPKHFPFPWFDSMLTSGDCASRIANLFSPTNGLYHDLQGESTTSAFSWISPNNCSDAHDAVCHGNNLSGGFSDPNTPNPPVNYTGGLYASDLFLEHIIPEIEASPAFKDGGRRR